MTFSPRFYRGAAVASFVSAATTLALIFLPRLYGAPDSLDARFALVSDPIWTLRAWVYFLHPFVVMAAAVGVGMRLRESAPGAVVVGLLGFLLWSMTEAGQQTLTLVAFRDLEAAWEVASSTVAREEIRVQVAMYDAVWSSMFLLLLVGFTLGNAAFGAALVGRGGVDAVLGGLFLVIAGLTVFNISGQLDGPVLPAGLRAWVYPVVQPVTRVAIGVWLWRGVGGGGAARRVNARSGTGGV